MSILTFQIDPQYDADMVFTMLNQNSAHDAAFRAKDMKLAGNLIDRIQSVSDYGEVKAVIMQTVADRHAEVKAQLENAVITYQASWIR